MIHFALIIEHLAENQADKRDNPQKATDRGGIHSRHPSVEDSEERNQPGKCLLSNIIKYSSTHPYVSAGYPNVILNGVQNTLNGVGEYVPELERDEPLHDRHPKQNMPKG